MKSPASQIVLLALILGACAPAVFAADMQDTHSAPVASTNNLFIDNDADAVGMTLERPVAGPATVIRSWEAFPPEDESFPIRITVPPAPISDEAPVRLASGSARMGTDAPFTAVQVAVELHPGDSAVLLDTGRTNAPLRTFTEPFRGWIPLASTTGVAIQVETNGDSQFEGSASILAIGDLAPLDLRLSDATASSARTGSTDGTAIGMTGAFEAGALWPLPIVRSQQPGGSAEEGDIQFLEKQLHRLTQVGAAGGDPVIREDDDAWTYLPGTFRADGAGNRTYRLVLDPPARDERSINALLNELGVTKNGVLRRVLVDASTLGPAEQNFRTLPQRVVAFSLDNGPETVLADPSPQALVAAIEEALAVEPSRASVAMEYLRSTMGVTLTNDRAALDRAALFYGTTVTGVRTDDTRREVALASWLQMLLAKERGRTAALPAELSLMRCPNVEACPEFHPLLPRTMPTLPEDAGRIIVSAESSGASGSWKVVAANQEPLKLPIGGVLTASTGVSALSLAPNTGSASRTYRFVAPRTAPASFALTRLAGPGLSPLAVKIHGPMGVVSRILPAGDALKSVDDSLGTFTLIAGEAVTVTVTASNALLGPLTVSFAETIPHAATSMLREAPAGATVTGGTFSPDGWRTDGSLAALDLTRESDPRGAHASVVVRGLRACPASGCPGPEHLLSLSTGGLTAHVRAEGTTLVLDGGADAVRRLPLDGRTDAALLLSIARSAVGSVATLRAEQWTVAVPLVAPEADTAAETTVRLGSLDPAAPTPYGLGFSALRLYPASLTPTVPQRTARSVPRRVDAHSYMLFASPNAELVRSGRAPSMQLPNASVDSGDLPSLRLTGLANGVPVYVAAAVLGPGGERSALSAIATVVPSSDAPVPPIPAIPAIGIAPVYDASLTMSGERFQAVPPSRAQLRLGDTLTLDPSFSVAEGTPDVLVQWSVGRDANISPDPATKHVYATPGAYQPTMRLLQKDGTVLRVAGPIVRVEDDLAPTQSLYLTPAGARIAAGESVSLRGAFRSGEEDLIPSDWRVRIDYGDGSAPEELAPGARDPLMRGPNAASPLTHRYMEPGSYTLSVTLDDVRGERQEEVRRTILVGAITDPGSIVSEAQPALRKGPGPVAFDARGIPEGLTFLAWDFGDARSTEEQEVLPSGRGLDVYTSPAPVTTSPLAVLGDVPLYLRVRSPDGTVALSTSRITVRPPVASLSLQEHVLFGSVPGATYGVALFRAGDDGTREYLTDVAVDASGFVLLPLGRSAAGDVVAAVRHSDGEELLGLDGVGALRSSLPLTAEPSNRGFSFFAKDGKNQLEVEVNFSADASVTTKDAQHGVLIRSMGEGVTLSLAERVPKLLRGEQVLLTFALSATPELGEGLVLVPQRDRDNAFAPLQLLLAEGETELARIELRPAGPITDTASGEGIVLTSQGAWKTTIDATARAALRRGDRLILAARDARGALSRDLTSFSVRAEDIASGRAPVFGVASGGSHTLVPLDTPGAVRLQANDTLPTLFGIAAPGATVEVTTRSKPQTFRVTADAQGMWRFTPEQPLEEGSHTVDILVDGKTTTIPLTVDLTAPERPAITGVQGSALTGTAEPESTVAYYDASHGSLGAVVADADGRFKITLPARIRTIVLKAVDAAGNVSDPTPFSVPDAIREQSANGAWRTWLSVFLALGGFFGLIALHLSARKHPVTPLD